MVRQMTTIIQNNLLTMAVGGLSALFGSLLALGFKYKTKTYVEGLFQDETKGLENKLNSITNKLDRMYKCSNETDLAILWGLLNDKINYVLTKELCDKDTLYYIENMFTRYKKLGGNHGMQLQVQKVRDLCNKEETKK